MRQQIHCYIIASQTIVFRSYFTDIHKTFLPFESASWVVPLEHPSRRSRRHSSLLLLERPERIQLAERVVLGLALGGGGRLGRRRGRVQLEGGRVQTGSQSAAQGRGRRRARVQSGWRRARPVCRSDGRCGRRQRRHGAGTVAGGGGPCAGTAAAGQRTQSGLQLAHTPVGGQEVL